MHRCGNLSKGIREFWICFGTVERAGCCGDKIAAILIVLHYCSNALGNWDKDDKSLIVAGPVILFFFKEGMWTIHFYQMSNTCLQFLFLFVWWIFRFNVFFGDDPCTFVRFLYLGKTWMGSWLFFFLEYLWEIIQLWNFF